MSHVFISYVRENQRAVDELCSDLVAAGVTVWLDRDQIQPGQLWKESIRRAIQAGAFFIACFSNEYNARSESYMNEELVLAIEELRKKSMGRQWFIPLRLSECEIPNRQIGGGMTLSDLQRLDLFGDRKDAVHRLVSLLRPGTPGEDGAGVEDPSEPKKGALVIEVRADIFMDRLAQAIQEEYEYLTTPELDFEWCYLEEYPFMWAVWKCYCRPRGAQGDARVHVFAFDERRNEYIPGAVVERLAKLLNVLPPSHRHLALWSIAAENVRVDTGGVSGQTYFDGGVLESEIVYLRFGIPNGA
jgi:hypothetical protein